jgi:V-type H+-transporting ATPase subunit C
LRTELKTRTDELTTKLKSNCEASFSELYIIYIHLKYLRFLVETVMRFGYGDNILPVIIAPNSGKEKRVIQALLKLFSEPS